jgi:peptidoglycan/LPS O-acetylase OafA/YrhL
VPRSNTVTSRRTIGDALSPRHNSLNFLRLGLALAVICSHSQAFGSWKGVYSLEINRTTLGTMAVYGFFGISGYLIAGSALRNRSGRYLWQRFLRIFPGFWVCLIVTAFVIGLFACLSAKRGCNQISCYFGAQDSPWGYVLRNLGLEIHQNSIAGLPRGPYNHHEWRVWNGSLWTLAYECLCYLLLAALGVVGLLRRRTVILGATIALIGTIAIITLTPSLHSHFNIIQNWFLMNLMRFAAVFLVGSLIYLYRDKLPDSGWLALACGALFLGTLWLSNDGHLPRNTFTDASFFAPAIGYPLIWLGAHLPFQRVGAQNDYSYGFYIYAYPVQQVLAIWGVTRLGYFGFTAAAIVATTPLAVGSWWFIEKHALKLKGVEFGPLIGRAPVATETST